MSPPPTPGGGGDAAGVAEWGFRGRRLVPGRIVSNVWENMARFRLYRHRFLKVNTRFAAFCEKLR